MMILKNSERRWRKIETMGTEREGEGVRILGDGNIDLISLHGSEQGYMYHNIFLCFLRRCTYLGQ